MRTSMRMRPSGTIALLVEAAILRTFLLCRVKMQSADIEFVVLLVVEADDLAARNSYIHLMEKRNIFDSNAQNYFQRKRNNSDAPPSRPITTSQRLTYQSR